MCYLAPTLAVCPSTPTECQQSSTRTFDSDILQVSTLPQFSNGSCLRYEVLDLRPYLIMPGELVCHGNYSVMKYDIILDRLQPTVLRSCDERKDPMRYQRRG